MSSSVRLLVVAVAVALVFVPLPRTLVETWYSQGLYPRLQGVVTPISNLVPLALLDVAVAVLMLVGLWMGVRALRRHGVLGALVKGLRVLVVGGAAAYLVFLAIWGLNYQRVPIEAALDYDSSRVTREAALALGAEAVRQVNAQREGAMIRPLDETALAAALAEQVRSLGPKRAIAIGRPKRSLMGLYFRRAAIDGMVNPFFLEIILNPDLLPMERPMVIAHEWAHLAGYAHETEASFLAWIACLQADPMARYSGWLGAYQYASASLSPADRRTLPPLADGPRADLRAMAARYQRSSPVVRTAARDVYDSYLRAHGIPEGVASYGAVVRLMLGVQFDDDRRPRLRSQ